MTKIRIPKAVMLTPEDEERVKDLPMREDQTTIHGCGEAKIYYKVDDAMNYYIFNIVVADRGC